MTYSRLVQRNGVLPELGEEGFPEASRFNKQASLSIFIRPIHEHRHIYDVLIYENAPPTPRRMERQAASSDTLGLFSDKLTCLSADGDTQPL